MVKKGTKIEIMRIIGSKDNQQKEKENNIENNIHLREMLMKEEDKKIIHIIKILDMKDNKSLKKS